MRATKNKPRDTKSEETSDSNSQTSEQLQEVEEDSSSTQSNSEREQINKMALNPHIEPFVIGETDLDDYLERLEFYYKFAKTTEDDKVSVIVIFGGEALHATLKNLVKPKKLSSMTYAEVTKIARDHFKPTTNVRAERFKFMSRVMSEDESLNEFIIALNTLADNCEYGDYLDQALSDKFIWSIKDANIQQKLIDQPTTKKFAEICTLAINMQALKRDVSEIQEANTLHLNRLSRGKYDAASSKNDLRNYLKSKEQSGFRKDYRNPNDYRKVYASETQRYNLKNKKSNDINVICFKCQKQGHYAFQCNYQSEKKYQRQPKRYHSEVKSIEPEEVNDDDVLNIHPSSEDEETSLLGSLTLGSNSPPGKSSPILINIFLAGIRTKMEIDSGACCSVMSSKQFKYTFENHFLHRLNRPLRLIDGNLVKVIGYVNLEVSKTENCSETNIIPLVIIETEEEFMPLLGRNWLDVLYRGWREYFTFKPAQIKSLASVKDLIIEKFPKLFDSDYTKPIRNHQADIILEDGAIPIFFRPYTIPYGLGEKVDQEI